MAGCGVVPVPFAGRGAGDAAGVEFRDLAAGWLVEARAFGEVEGLPGGVSVLRDARAGLKIGGGCPPTSRFLGAG